MYFIIQTDCTLLCSRRMVAAMAYHPVSTTRSRNNAVEVLRQALPLNTYLAILHQGATMGSLPILNESGKPTGEFVDLPPRERLETVKYLINKVMPDIRSTDPVTPPTSDLLLEDDATANMTTEELIATIQAATPTPPPVDVEFTNAPR